MNKKADDQSSTGRATFRPAEIGDIEKMWEIDQACFDEEISFPPDVFYYHLLLKTDPAFVAEKNGKIAGFVITSSKGKDSAQIVTIDVLPEFRRLGIGTVLMDSAESAQALKNKKNMILQTPIENRGAIEFYLGRGYKKGATLCDYYGRGRDAFLFSKEIYRGQ